MCGGMLRHLTEVWGHDWRNNKKCFLKEKKIYICSSHVWRCSIHLWPLERLFTDWMEQWTERKHQSPDAIIQPWINLRRVKFWLSSRRNSLLTLALNSVVWNTLPETEWCSHVWMCVWTFLWALGEQCCSRGPLLHYTLSRNIFWDRQTA